MHENTSPNGFEEAVSRLEEIVNALEAGNLPLEESLRQFEEAVALSRLCSTQLDAAEKRISILTAEGELQEDGVPSWAADGVRPEAG